MKIRDNDSSDQAIPAGIVIRGTAEAEAEPVITAFIWGGKVREGPTLPFGRWKPTAA